MLWEAAVMSHHSNSKPLGRPRTKEKQMPTDELILQKAASLFLESGFQQVSIDHVASEANVTKATIYYYFESKSELYKEAIVSLMRRIKEQVERLMSSNKPLYERLYDVTEAHLRSTTPHNLDSFSREVKKMLSHEQIDYMKQVEEQIYEGIELGLLEAVEAGEIPEINVKFATKAYLSLVRVGNIELSEDSQIFTSLNDAVDSILNVFWRGFFGDQIKS